MAIVSLCLVTLLCSFRVGTANLLSPVLGNCGQTNFTAYEGTFRTATTEFLRGKVHCNWTISSWRKLNESEYLVVFWNKFSVPSAMPACNGTYVQLFTTKKRYRHGKFCSKQTYAKWPFNIFSYDGHAQIEFMIDTDSGGKLEIYFIIEKLRPLPLCWASTIDSDTFSIVIQSVEWPKPTTGKRCGYTITSKPKTITRIAVMDMNLMPSDEVCKNESGFIEIKGWNEMNHNRSIILQKSCGSRVPFIIESQYQHIEVTVDTSSNFNGGRGFLAGIFKYTTEPPPIPIPETDFPMGIVIGATFSVFLVLVIGCFVRRCIQKRTSEASQRRHLLQQSVNTSHPAEMSANTQGYASEAAVPPSEVRK